MTQKYDKLSEAGKRLARIPRFGRLLGQMTDERLSKISSRAATYLELFSWVDVKNDPDHTGLIDSGLNTSGAKLLGWVGSEADETTTGSVKPNRSNQSTREWQCQLAMNILAAIAFEMYCHNQKLDRPPTHPIDQNLEEFKQNACLRCSNAGAYVNRLGHRMDALNLIENDLPRIEQMNSFGLEYAVLSSTGERQPDSFGDPRQQLLFFSDVSTQAFFAAYWAVKWSSEDEDVKAVSHWIPDPITQQNKEYLEFWEMVLEIPEKVVDKQRFQNLFSVHFDCRLQPNPNRPIRSTKLIYRAWDRMTGSAALVAYQSEFARLVSDGNPVAKGLLKDEEGTSAFIQLADRNDPRDEWDTGKFMMGAPDGEEPKFDGSGEDQDNPQHEVKLSPYRLHRFCVTNAEYELFDPAHEAHREFGDEVDVTRHPVVRVSWFDAWCFSRWLSELEIESAGRRLKYIVTLPSKAQWEYGCRCGSDEPLTWHDRQNGDRIELGYCNFGNYPLLGEEGSQSSKVKKAVYLGRTIAVDGYDAKLTVNRNPWGLYQMHGNVWEWCIDWWGEDYYRNSPPQDPHGPLIGLNRVLRGGGRFNRGGLCRSGSRSRRDPAVRFRDYGFRLAVVLVSQSRSGQRAPVGVAP